MSAPTISVKKISKRYYIEQRGDGPKVMGFIDLLKLPFRTVKGDLFYRSAQRDHSIWALKDISFDVGKGERLGIIGKNGAGKTTLLKILSRLVYPTEGEAILYGRTTALFGVGTGFKPKLTGKENIFYSAALHGMSKEEVKDSYTEIVEFSGLERFIDMPIKYYSKGMYARLAFSVAAHLNPEILLLDEVLSGGDMAFRKKCLDKIEGQARSGRTILFVSHSMNAVIDLCNRCLWIEDGRIMEEGAPKDVIRSYSRRMLKLKSIYQINSSNEKQPESAVENSMARGAPGASLLSFELSDKEGCNKELFIRDEPIIIKIKYKILREHIPILPVFHLHKGGEHVLSSHPDEIYQASPGSVCLAKTMIPGRMLNSGEYDFSVAIVTPGKSKWRHVYLENILSIKIVNELDEKRIFPEYKGVVRPDFQWASSRLDFCDEQYST